MNIQHSLRRPATIALAIALLGSLFCAGRSAVQPPVASAQVFGCGPFQPYTALYGSSCLNGLGGICGLAPVFGCSPYGNLYGNAYGYPYGCAGSPYACAAGGACLAPLFAPGCSGVGSASCTGRPLQVGQSCANGVITSSAALPGVAGVCGGGIGIQPCSSPPGAATPGYISVAAPPSSAAPPQSVTCTGGGSAPAGQSCGAPAQAMSPATQPAASTSAASLPSFGQQGQGSGLQVPLVAGWNLISGPGGTVLTGVSGSLFTYQAGDTNYEVLPVSGTLLKAGQGYWLNVAQATQISLPSSVGATVKVSLPAGQYVMVGNPGITAATVSGADTVLVYDASTSSYTSTTRLNPGQGAWALSNSGGQATITNTP
jgi:hypothetical protein